MGRQLTRLADVMSEREWQEQVIDVAHMHGWMVAHFRRVTIKNGGHTTPVQADGAGYPDLTMAHPVGGVIFVELKAAKGRLTEEQKRWRDQLQAAGARWYVWKPRDWNTVVGVLSGTADTSSSSARVGG